MARWKAQAEEGLASALRSVLLKLKGKESIVHVDASNFDDVIKSADVALVAFTSPSCSHCRKLAPELRTAATSLEQEAGLQHGQVVVALVDATKEQNKPLARAAGVKNYPTLKVYRKGQPAGGSAYEGGRNAKELQLSALLLLGPDVEPLGSSQQLQQLRDRFPTVVLGVFPHASAAAVSHFEATAAALRHKYKFASSPTPDTVPECQQHPDWCSDPAAVLLYKPFDEGVSVYQGDFDEHGLADWLANHALPRVLEIRDATWDAVTREVYSSKLPRVVAVTDEASLAATRHAVSDAASRLEGYKFIIAHSNVSWVLPHFGLVHSQLPAFIIMDQAGKHLKDHFKPEQCLAEWIREYEEGALPLYYKSGPDPGPSPGLVAHVTANTFQEQVVSSPLPVLLELHRPNCPACAKFAPEYVAAAKQLQAAGEHVAVAQLNVAENDIPDDRFKVTHIPTVFLVVENDVVQYSGANSRDALVQWVRQQLAAAGASLQANPQKEEL